MKKQKSLTEGPILRTLLRFAFPVLAALFLQAMYGAVDLLVVGQFAETADISGVASGSMLTHTITAVITGLSMGITVLVGETIGRKDVKATSRAIGNGICLFAVLAILLSIFMVTGAGFLTEMMHAPSDAYDETRMYILICGAGSFFIIAYNVIGAIFRGIGDSKTPLVTVAIACVINIIADLLFVAVLGMGAAGAALATVLSQTVSVIASLLMIRKKDLPFTFTRRDIRFHKRTFGKILMLGVPIAFQEFLVGISFLVIQTIVNSIGLNESAGVGVGEKVCMFLMLVASAFMQSMSAFVAQNLGAGRMDRSKKALWYGIGTALISGVFMAYLAFFHGDLLASIFSNEPIVIEQAHTYLKAYAIDCLFTPFLFCFIGFFNGCEKTMFVMFQGVFAAFCVRIPVALFMSQLAGTTLFHIGLATPCASVVQITMFLFVYIRMNKIQKRTP